LKGVCARASVRPWTQQRRVWSKFQFDFSTGICDHTCTPGYWAPWEVLGYKKSEVKGFGGLGAKEYPAKWPSDLRSEFSSTNSTVLHKLLVIICVHVQTNSASGRFSFVKKYVGCRSCYRQNVISLYRKVYWPAPELDSVLLTAFLDADIRKFSFKFLIPQRHRLTSRLRFWRKLSAILCRTLRQQITGNEGNQLDEAQTFFTIPQSVSSITKCTQSDATTRALTCPHSIWCNNTRTHVSALNLMQQHAHSPVRTHVSALNLMQHYAHSPVRTHVSTLNLMQQHAHSRVRKNQMYPVYCRSHTVTPLCPEVTVRIALGFSNV
jgi:hypothetical protein